MDRYIRQIQLKEIGKKGQKIIKSSRILVVGAGGIGSPILLYLVAAGFCNIGIIDNDTIDITNLHRQILYNEDNIGEDKVEIAHSVLKKLNSQCNLDIYNKKLAKENINDIFNKYDFIIDGTDNFRTRGLINNYAYIHKKILITGAVKGFEAQLLSFDYKKQEDLNLPCYQCFYPDINADYSDKACYNQAVIGFTCATIAGFLGMEILKLTLDLEHNLLGKIMFINLLNNNIRISNLSRDPKCALCNKDKAT